MTQAQRVPAYWCVNFDRDQRVLRYGLDRKLWLMQYQWPHEDYDGRVHDFENWSQSEDGTLFRPGARFCANWSQIRCIHSGDWCVAYLPSPARFYAIGEVIKPRKSLTLTDNIARTLREERHLHFSQTVQYTDSEGDAFYEDFTEDWYIPLNNPRCRACRTDPEVRERCKYAQRIDVEQWKCRRDEGVRMIGLQNGRLENIGLAAFRISKEFFDEVKASLCGR